MQNASRDSACNYVAILNVFADMCIRICYVKQEGEYCYIIYLIVIQFSQSILSACSKPLFSLSIACKGFLPDLLNFKRII